MGLPQRGAEGYFDQNYTWTLLSDSEKTPITTLRKAIHFVTLLYTILNQKKKKLTKVGASVA